MKDLTDRVVLVTGAAGGIGRATALEFARRGAHVAIADVRPAEAAATAAQVEALGRRATVHELDVRDHEAWSEVAGAVEAHFGACHVLVNNAGVTSAGGFEQEPLGDLEWLVDINVWGVVHGCRAMLPALRRADRGHIVNVSSMVGLVGLPHNVAYSLTKGAVRSLSEGLRAELITSDIGVTVVFPGAIDTEIADRARGSEAHRLVDMGRHRTARKVLTRPTTVADRIVDAVQRNRPRVVVGADAHLVSGLSRVLAGRSGLVGRATNRVLGS